DLVGNAEFGDHPLIGINFHMRLDVVFGCRRTCFRVGDDERQRPLAPFLVLDADHRDVGYAAVLRDDVFELERGDPFPAGLNDVLDAISDLNIAVGTDVPDVVGVQVSTGPQLL